MFYGLYKKSDFERKVNLILNEFKENNDVILLYRFLRNLLPPDALIGVNLWDEITTLVVDLC